MTERVAIARAGIAGAYLYRLLRNGGVRRSLFDRRAGTRCGFTSCAWGRCAETTPFDCERIVDSGFGWLTTMEE